MSDVATIEPQDTLPTLWGGDDDMDEENEK